VKSKAPFSKFSDRNIEDYFQAVGHGSRRITETATQIETVSITSCRKQSLRSPNSSYGI
jgi:hypothetical protein